MFTEDVMKISILARFIIQASSFQGGRYVEPDCRSHVRILFQTQSFDVRLHN